LFNFLSSFLCQLSSQAQVNLLLLLFGDNVGVMLLLLFALLTSPSTPKKQNNHLTGPSACIENFREQVQYRGGGRCCRLAFVLTPEVAVVDRVHA
jgi:hypothetical protein